MARTIGYRLESGLAHDLAWLFSQAGAAVSGLGAQCYSSSSAGTDPSRLLLQERVVESSRDSIRREARLLGAARRMVESGPGGAAHWSNLKVVYGEMRRDDPYEMFDKEHREQAALARYTPSVLLRATEEWVEWHCRRREGLDVEVRGFSGGKGSKERSARAAQWGLDTLVWRWNESRLEGDFLRVWSVLPAEPPPAELEEVVSQVLDGLCGRLREARKMNQPEKRGDRDLASAVHAETDAVLSDASLAFARAHRAHAAEEASYAARKRREDEAEAVAQREEAREHAERVLAALRAA